MDATMQPGLNNFVMKGMESMYLPRIPASILQNVSASQTVTVTLKPEATLDLPPAQQPFQSTPGLSRAGRIRSTQVRMPLTHLSSARARRLSP